MKTKATNTTKKNPYATLTDAPIKVTKPGVGEPKAVSTKGGDLRGGKK